MIKKALIKSAKRSFLGSKHSPANVVPPPPYFAPIPGSWLPGPAPANNERPQKMKSVVIDQLSSSLSSRGKKLDRYARPILNIHLSLDFALQLCNNDWNQIKLEKK